MDENKLKQNELLEAIREMNRASDPNKLQAVSMSEMYETVYQSQPAVIEDFLYPGLCVLAGDSKIGKSFLVSQIAFHVATGKEFWNKSVSKGTVLYLALEDQYSRIQKRMFKMYGEENTSDLYFSITASTITAHLENQLNDFVRGHPGTNLIIIDTMQKVRGGVTDNYSYSKDYEFISQLKKIADDNSLCLLLVHHTKKMKDDKDPQNDITGTKALMAAADSSMVLVKESRTSLNAILNITGRDQPDTRIKIRKNPETLIWESEEFETDIYKEPPDPLLQNIADTVIRNGGKWSGSATELAALSGADIKPNKLTLKLNINASKLRYDHGIDYKNVHTHNGRFIEFQLVEKRTATVGDDCDDKMPCGVLP